MRVLYFTREFTWHDRRFLEAIVGLGCEAGVLSLRDSAGAKRRVVVPAGVVDLGDLGLAGQPGEGEIESLASRCRERFAQFAPDVVHAGPITDAAFVAVQATEVPVIACSWAFDVLLEAAGDAVMFSRAQAALRKCGGLLVDCVAVLDRCREMAGRSFADATILPWGIDFDQLKRADRREAMRASLGWADKKIVLSTRSFEKLYDLSTLLRAFGLAMQQDPALRLALVGDGSERRALQELAASLGVADGVRFVGAVSRDVMGDWFSASDLYVSCAQTDGTSVSLLEAMATGLLPIVTDLPSNREWVEAGESGWLAAFGDVPQFTRALVEAGATDPQRRQTMADRNRRVVKARADWSRNVVKLKRLYEQSVNVAAKA